VFDTRAPGRFTGLRLHAYRSRRSAYHVEGSHVGPRTRRAAATVGGGTVRSEGARDPLGRPPQPCEGETSGH